MKKLLVLFLYVIFCNILTFAQGEGNHWYFGYNAGLDFTSGSPLPDLNGALNTWEGCSSVSDKNGNLLFYTDGSTVYDRNHNVMPNGTGLLGNSSSTQSAIIVKKPGTDSIYYVFTTPAVSSGGLYYSEINLMLNGGLGDIVISTKNTNLLPIIGERITATKHSNGIYTWVITKATNTNSYYAYLINCNGVQLPVITAIGWTASGNNAGATVASPNSRKVASTFFSSTNGIEILDFDNSTGIFSNVIMQAEGIYPYGACFSPNSNVFYFSNISTGNVTQLDLSAINVFASATVVGNISSVGPSGFRAGALQLGPDGKIYMAENGQGNISVINDPNIVGAGCNFAGDIVSLGGKTSGLGLPALFLNYIDTTVINYQYTCFNIPTLFSLGSDTTALDSVHWNFGDLLSGNANFSNQYAPSHLFSTTGNYTVQVIRYFLCGSDTSSINITIVPDSFVVGISGSDSICSGQSLQLMATGGITYNWSGPNNFSDTAQSITVNNLTNPGLYTVVAKDTYGCTDTANTAITILPNPVAVANSNSPVAIGTSINLLTDTISGINWSGPNGFNSIQQNPVIANAQLVNSGIYQVIKTNVFGCKDTAEVDVFVYQPELPDNTIDDDGDGLIDCADPDLATLHQCYACGYDSIAWKTVIPESGFNRGIAVKYTGFDQYFIVPAGVTSLKIKVWGAGGGGSSYNGQNAGGGAGGYTEGLLTVSPGSALSLMVGEGGACDGTADNISYGFGGAYSAANFGGFGGGLSGIFTPGAALTPTDQARSLLVAGGGGGGERAAPSNFCTSGGQGGDTLFGGGMPAMQGENGNPKTGAGGGGGYYGGLMTLRLSGNGTYYAGEGGTNFIHPSVTSGLSLFSADFGSWNTFPAMYKEPPNTTDIHYESFISSTNPGIGTGSMYTFYRAGNGRIVIQWFEPIEDLTIISSKDTVCNGDTLTLTAIGQANYIWSPAATLNNDTATTVIAQPVADITYQVISDVNNCMDTAQIQIIVNQIPVLTTTNDTAICYGDSLLLTTSGADIYTWSPVLGLNTSSGATVIAKPLINTKYIVNGTFNNGCSSTDSVYITVDSIPIPVVSGNPAFCLGDSITIYASGGNHYLWNNGDTTAAISVAPAFSTIYSVIVKNSFNCIDSATFGTTVHPLPYPAFSSTNVCDGTDMMFNNLSNINPSDTINSYLWDFGDGSILDTAQYPLHLFAQDSSYLVTLVVFSNFGCVDSVSHLVFVNPKPVVSFVTNDTVGCAQLCVPFQDQSSIHTGSNSQWTWNFGDGSPTNNTANPSHCYNNNSSPISYTVNLTITSDSGCVTSLSKNNYITVHPNPTAQFFAPGVCEGTNVLFTDSSSIPSGDTINYWAWNFGDGSPINTNDSVVGGHLYASPNIYTSSLLVVSNAGCRDSVAKTIVIHPNPVSGFFVSANTGCEPLCISFSDSSAIISGSTITQWIWNIGDGSIVNSSPAFDHCYVNDSASSAIHYSITLTVVSDSGCTNTFTKNNYITVYPNSEAGFSALPQSTTITNSLISITNTSVNADSCYWNFGDTQSSLLINPVSHQFQDTGTYNILLITNTMYGCIDSAYQTVIIEPDFLFYIPSAFSPNDDNVNDTFTGRSDYIKEFEMLVFDRWGNLLYKTNDINKPWNGKVNNGADIAQCDVYVYSIKVVDLKLIKHSFRGTVTLIR